MHFSQKSLHGFALYGIITALGIVLLPPMFWIIVFKLIYDNSLAVLVKLADDIADDSSQRHLIFRRAGVVSQSLPVTHVKIEPDQILSFLECIIIQTSYPPYCSITIYCTKEIIPEEICAKIITVTNMNDILKEELVYEGRICKMTHDTVTFEDGTTGFRDVLHLPGAVAVLALTDRNTILFVQQYRHAVEKELLEIPAGMLEKGEDPVEAALRELQEETGYKARHIEHLTDFFTSPGVVKETISLYFANDLEYVHQDLDEDEFLKVKEFTVAEVEAMVNAHEITDGKTILAFLLCQKYFK